MRFLYVFLGAFFFLSSAAIADEARLRHTGWEPIRIVSVEGSHEIWEVVPIGSNPTYVLLHDVPDDVDLVKFDKREDGSRYRVSLQLSNTFERLGLRPNLPSGYPYTDVRVYHYSQRFTNPNTHINAGEQRENPVYSHTITLFADGRFLNEYYIAELDLPKTSIRDVKISLGLLEAPPVAQFETDQMLAALNAETLEEFQKDRATFDQLLNRLTRIGELGFLTAAYQDLGSFEGCAEGATACNINKCRSHLRSASRDARAQGRLLRDFFIRPEGSFQLHEIPWQCGFYIGRDMLNNRHSDQVGSEDWVFVRDAIAFGYAETPERMHRALWNFGLMFAQGRNQFGLVDWVLERWSPPAGEFQVYQKVRAFYDTHDFAERLGFSGTRGVLTDASFAPDWAFRVDERVITYADVIPHYAKLTALSNQPPWISFLDDERTVHVLWIDFTSGKLRAERLNLLQLEADIRTDEGRARIMAHPISQLLIDADFSPPFREPEQVGKYLRQTLTYHELQDFASAL